MIKFFDTPNMPDRKVKGIICGKTDKIIYDFLKSYDIDVFVSDTNCDIDERISNHADINVHHLGGNNIVVDRSQSQLYKILSDIGMDVKYCYKRVNGSYPDDCKLNLARIGNNIIGKISVADKEILNHIKSNNINRINVNQGYGKCSILILNTNAIITDDESVSKNAIESGFDVLLISKGDIILNGFNYGFIGGASGLISNNTVAFFGDIRKHRNFSEIADFLDKHGINYVYIENYPITDIGGIIQIY